MKMRTQLTALFILTVTTGIFGTAFFSLRSYVEDKRSYVTELNSVSAPKLASELDAAFDQLAGNLGILEQLLARGQINSGAIEALSERLSGVGAIEVFSKGQRAALLSLDALASKNPDEKIVDPKSLAQAPLNPGNFVLIESAASRCIAAVERVSQTKAYSVCLRQEFFTKTLSGIHALASAVVRFDGSMIAGIAGGNTDLGQRVPLPAQSILQNSQVVSTEIRTARGDAAQAAFAPLRRLDRTAVLVMAPPVTVETLARPFLKSAMMFIFVILAISALLGIIFAARIARPLEELTQATLKITEGSWDVPLHSSRVSEVGALVRSFSKMGQGLKARDQALAKANQELVRSESLSAVGRFSAGIAHEVKNPLSSILGYAQLIERKLPAETLASLPYVKYIQDETRRASKIITDLLSFSRQKPPELRPLPLEPVLSRAAEMLRPQCESSGVTLSVEIRETSLKAAPKAAIDPEQIFQVVLNLVQNSIQAGAKRVDLRLFSADSAVKIEIVDDGPGIPKENLSKIFEPFFSTKEIGKGSGLGLSLCHSILAQHGGKITVDSEPGKGARFALSLPVVVE